MKAKGVNLMASGMFTHSVNKCSLSWCKISEGLLCRFSQWGTSVEWQPMLRHLYLLICVFLLWNNMYMEWGILYWASFHSSLSLGFILKITCIGSFSLPIADLVTFRCMLKTQLRSPSSYWWAFGLFLVWDNKHCSACVLGHICSYRDS